MNNYWVSDLQAVLCVCLCVWERHGSVRERLGSMCQYLLSVLDWFQFHRQW